MKIFCNWAKYIFLSLGFILLSSSVLSQRLMENLGRGVVAIHKEQGKVFISWRVLGTDPKDISFNLYRATNDGKEIKLNEKVITGATNFLDENPDMSKNNLWFVRPIVNNKELKSSGDFKIAAGAPVKKYLSIPVRTPERYRPNDCSVGDLDGDGEYEIIVHMSGRGIDNPSNGFSDIPIFQAYELDGTFLWEINLGKNIREGAHYTQFMVMDFDGDGFAEMACKTADGTIDGKGKIIGDAGKDWRNTRTGKILGGPEFFTIFDGKTGAALVTTDYLPSRYPTDGWGGNGGNMGTDDNGNRVDRFLACVAYLDGNLPSIVMCRGYYGRSVLSAWDWRNGKLKNRWIFDTQNGENPFSGQGNHNLSVTDVDNDGKDEIIYGSMVVDDNGKGLFSTGFRHGDALHVGDLDPDRPGLEVFGIHENETNNSGPGAALFNAMNGEVYWRGAEGKDVGRGVAEDIDPDNRGSEMWFSGSNGLLNMKGERIGDNPGSTNFLIWWDGCLTRQLLDGNRISKYKSGVIFTAEGCSSNNGSKSNPALSADILGDWREELIMRTNDNKELRVFVTTIPTDFRTYTLMHDPQYRLSIAWQNVAYNQPPHLSFWLGAGIGKIPQPIIKTEK